LIVSAKPQAASTPLSPSSQGEIATIATEPSTIAIWNSASEYSKFGSVVACVLPLLGSGHQLLLALGGGRFALVPRYRVAIALDELIHPGPLFRRQIGRRGSGQFEFLGRGLQKDLPDILRLIEGVSVRGEDVRVQHLLGCLGAAERRYR
jgi:hypothetical protein